MANILDPKTGLLLAAPYQSNQFVATKRDRRWMAFFASRVVSDTACASLPTSPVEGQAVIVFGGTNANSIARYSTELSAWEYLAPWAGLTVQDATGASWSYSGSTWVQQQTGGGGSVPAWVANHPDTPPAVAGAYDDEFATDRSVWSWINQGAAAYEISGGYLHLAIPADRTGDNLRCRVFAVSGPWDFRAKITLQPKAMINYAQGGMVLRNSATGKMLTLTLSYDSGQGGWVLDFDAWTSVTAFSAKIAGSMYVSQQAYLRLKNDGTTISAYYSFDGRIWTLFESQAVSGFIAAVDQAGIYGSSSRSNMPVDVMCDWIRS